jgi:hypothetical protein
MAAQAARETAPTRVEVPVERVEVKITIEDMLAALAEQARVLAEATGGTAARGVSQPAGDVARRLTELSALALALKSEVDQIRRLDPALASRLQRGDARA